MFYVLFFIILNGLFAMSEIAVVSASKARLRARANEGNQNAKAALKLAESPNDFLSTVQIGITLVSILSGAFGGATIAGQLEPLLRPLPIIGGNSAEVSFALVVTVITYLTLVIGELAPKQIALNNAEQISMLIARPMRVLAWLAAPLVTLLSFSSRMIVRMLRLHESNAPIVTREEVQLMIEQGTESGIFEPINEEMVEQMFRLSDRRVNELMTPRPDVVLLDLNEPPESLREKIIKTGHSRYPVVQGDEDNVVGIVLARDLLAQSLAGDPFNLNAILRSALVVPESLPLLDMLERFKEAHAQIAIIIDEYGELEGVITFNDMLEEVVGDVPEVGDPADPEAIPRPDGTWLIDGMYPIEAFKDLFDIKALPDEIAYQTLGGFVLTHLGRVPEAGDTFEWDAYRFEIMDMDWRRVDKVLLTLLEAEAQDEEEAA